ncbi:hypothetical protein [Pontibacillus salipaludis]|uniref:hypothetical protein n=1 Tax=Pontibacillus salipaludis TaxID=1697394 RepID=UPI0031E7592F
MRNVYTRTTVPDEKCYVPTKSANDYKIGETYDFLFWNRKRLERNEDGKISDNQIPASFYILEGRVTDINQHLVVKFEHGVKEPFQATYSLNQPHDENYLHSWKVLVNFTRNEGNKTSRTGVTEDEGSVHTGVTEDYDKRTGYGVTEDHSSTKTGTGVTEHRPTGVTEVVQ